MNTYAIYGKQRQEHVCTCEYCELSYEEYEEDFGGVYRAETEDEAKSLFRGDGSYLRHITNIEQLDGPAVWLSRAYEDPQYEHLITDGFAVLPRELCRWSCEVQGKPVSFAPVLAQATTSSPARFVGNVNEQAVTLQNNEGAKIAVSRHYYEALSPLYEFHGTAADKPITLVKDGEVIGMVMPMVFSR